MPLFFCISYFRCILATNKEGMKKLMIIAIVATTLASCVSTKKFKAEQDKLNLLNTKIKSSLSGCEEERNALSLRNKALQDEADLLRKQIDFLKENSTTAIKQLQDLSVISAKQAESISKSLDNIGAKDAYIQNLQSSMARKDSLNMALVINLKGAIGNLDDKDIQIKVDKGVVYIDISDKLLFNSGSYVVTSRAKEVLGKVAKVLKAHTELEFMIEGHTDNVPYRANGNLEDNWDLSVKRATTVARILQKQYGLDPAQITAAGRSEYKPLVSNINDSNRALNRRTRIIVLPQLDQFFKLLERK
jgi:chemotaxis protein MotB